jgi:hypothetical protein
MSNTAQDFARAAANLRRIAAGMIQNAPAGQDPLAVASLFLTTGVQLLVEILGTGESAAYLDDLSDQLQAGQVPVN